LAADSQQVRGRRGQRPRTLARHPADRLRPKAALVGAILQPAGANQLAQTGKIRLDGDPSVWPAFAGLLDEFGPDFNIVMP
jgi:ubiquinone biosynthesis protein UbiJ